MRKIIFFMCLFFIEVGTLNAQNLIGISNSNYAGTNGLYTNPSSMVDSRYGFYLNLFTFDVYATNNAARYTGPFSVLDINSISFDEDFIKYYDHSKVRLVSAGVDLRLPSFMMRLDRDNSIAFTSRFRAGIQLDNVSDELFRFGIKLAQADPDNADYSELAGQLENGSFNLNVNMFSEFGLSYGRTIFDLGEHYLKGGITLKYLSGIYNTHMHIKDVDYEFVSTNTYDSVFIDNLDMKAGYTSSDIINGDIDASTIFNSIFSGSNGAGFGVDAGVIYEWRPDIDKYKYTLDGEEGFLNNKNKYKLRVGLSLQDMGGINYKGGVQYDVNRQDLDLDVDEVDNTVQTAKDQNPENSAYIGAAEILLDLDESEKIIGYRSGLPTALNLNVDYQIAEKLYVNAAWIQNMRSKDAVAMKQLSSLSIAPRVEMGWFGLSIPFVLHTNYQQFSVGAMLRLGPVFVGSDNLGFLVGSELYGANLYAGINVPIPKGSGKPKDSDGDGISDDKDLCPDVAGLPEFNGCPDTDGDSIPDAQDACPNEAGVKEFGGCPDSDGDGVQDSQDDCPDTPGLKDFNGCPDTDGDGITDAEDDCPEEAGPPSNNGCPLNDRDNDGVSDENDNCPDTPGLPEFNGCPDRDGDGTPDKMDQCPDLPGPKDKFGCPDSDGDGIFDNEDKCPQLAGIPENNGCPYADSDGDGIKDEADKCPDQAGPPENGGCPYADTDGDGIIDKEDDCPTTPGVPENKGCPAIEETLKTAFDNLQFETGKAIIKTYSYPSLMDLASVLKQKENWKLLVEGHTDSRGGYQFNIKLSERRAQAVADFMMKQGISKDRLMTVGYGPDKPIATNETADGRAKNRRVEMTVVDEKGNKLGKNE